jgi:hypothetical protein
VTEQLIDEPSAFLSAQPIALSSSPTAACACGHEMVRHDETALRYCRATTSNELRRDCICNVARAQPMSRR